MMFSGNSILDEIRRLHEEGRTGTLTLAGDADESLEIFFREGMIEAASSNSGASRIGDYLVKGGLVPARDLDALQSEAQRCKIFLGEAVVRKKLADPAYVGTAVRNQSMHLLDRAVSAGFSVNGFTPCLRAYFAPARISFQQVALQLARNHPASFEGDRETQIAIIPDIDLSLFPWYPQEIFVLKQLGYPNTLRAILASTGLGEPVLRKMLGIFLTLGIIDTEQGVAGWMTEGSVVVRRSEFAFESLIPVVSDAVLSEKLEVARAQSSFTSEQFRNLKIQLRETDSQALLKVFTVSSPEAQDGKSFVSINLAFSFAKDSERRVLLMDCDLRGPSVAEYFGIRSEPGLLQYMENDSLTPYCFVRRFENLYVMTAGGVASNPIEILSMRKMRELLGLLRNDFDTIILDAPPYSPIADARVVTGLSDGLLMVVRRGRTSYTAADRAFKAVDRNKLLGVVFNDVKPLLFNTYPNFGYYEYGKKQLAYANSDSNESRSKTYLDP